METTGHADKFIYFHKYINIVMWNSKKIQKITHKFTLYPNKQIEAKMLETLEICRQAYNILLEELNKQKVINKTQLQSILPDMKICDPKFKKVHSKTLQYECYRLFSNLKALIKAKQNGRKIGKLRFKGKNWFKTFTYNQSGFKLINTGKRHQTFQDWKNSNQRQ